MAVTAYVGPNSPLLTVEIDFTNAPSNASRSWTDVTNYVRQVTLTRAGRNNALGRTEPGTLSMLLDNRDGRFDPTNTGGAYYPNVTRMRWLRVTATWSGTAYRRFTGLTESWRLSWPEAGKDATAEVTAVDAMKVLNLQDMSGGLSGGLRTVDTWISALIPTGIPKSLAAGDLVLPSISFTAATVAEVNEDPLTNMLEFIQSIAEDTECGLFFAAGDGTLTFQDRRWRWTNANSITSRATIGERAQDIPYTEGELTADDEYLWNTANITSASGAVQNASDATSVTKYFARTYQRSVLAADQEAMAVAQRITQLYDDPPPRVPHVELVVAADTSKWATVLSAVNSERFTFRRAATGHTISQDVFLERVSESITPGQDWRVAWDLSPAEAAPTEWILGTSQLGTNTNVAF